MGIVAFAKETGRKTSHSLGMMSRLQSVIFAEAEFMLHELEAWAAFAKDLSGKNIEVQYFRILTHYSIF